MSHTPGPWNMEFDCDDGGRRFFCILADNGTLEGGNIILDGVDIEGETEAEQMANAMLIAAAPDLLDALKEIISGWVGWERVEEIARAAIAKAEGHEP